MLYNNFFMYSIKILGEIGRDFLMFPIWWYTRGLWQTVQGIITFLKNRQKSLALMVWIKNIFRPMFGQTDWQGKLISIFIRAVQIVFRSFIMFFWIIFAFVLLVVWIALPLFILYQIYFQFSGLYTIE